MRLFEKQGGYSASVPEKGKSIPRDNLFQGLLPLARYRTAGIPCFSVIQSL